MFYALKHEIYRTFDTDDIASVTHIGHLDTTRLTHTHTRTHTHTHTHTHIYMCVYIIYI